MSGAARARAGNTKLEKNFGCGVYKSYAELKKRKMKYAIMPQYTLRKIKMRQYQNVKMPEW